jgi:DnaJ-class molecular chaperone
LAASEIAWPIRHLLDMMDSDEILSNLFRGARTHVHADGRDVQYKLPVEFLAAANGATSRVILPDGSALDVVVPAGTRDRQIPRLRGKGAPSLGGGKPGDALVEIEVKPHRGIDTLTSGSKEA